MSDLARINIDETGYGPAMRALPDQRRAFVVALVQNGYTATDAARAAGYSASSDAVLRVQGYKLAHDPRVQAAIHEECLKIVRSDVPMALRVLRTVAADDAAPHRDRIKAAAEILNRGGLHAISERNVNLTVGMSESEKDREIAALCAELGLDDRAKAKLLGKPVVDAEYTEIVDPPLPEIAPPRDPSNGGRPITSSVRTPEDRAKQRAIYRETPEERAARQARNREEASQRGKEIFAAAQAARAADEIETTAFEQEQ